MSRLTAPMILGVGGLIFILYTALWCVPRAVERVETDILARGSTVVAANRADIKVDVDGQRLILTGTVDSDSARTAIVSRVAALRGVTGVVDQLSVTQAQAATIARPQAYRFRAMFRSNDVVLTGFVPDDGVRASLVGHARRSFGAARVIDQLAKGDGAPAGYAELVKRGVSALARLDRGNFRFDGRRAMLEGVAPDPDTRTAVDMALAANGPFVITTELSLRPADDTRRASCQSQFNRALRGQSVNFATSSATINADSFPLLDELAAAVKSCADVRVGVYGHTDAMGDPQFNINLSQARAEAVVDYLHAEGVPRANMLARGYGSSEPRESNDTRAGRAANRRIELIVLDGSDGAAATSP